MQFRLSVEAACKRTLSISDIGCQRGFAASESSGVKTSGLRRKARFGLACFAQEFRQTTENPSGDKGSSC